MKTLKLKQEEGTEDILDKNINWEVTIEIPITVQEQNGDISSDKEYFDGVMDELIDFTRREMKCQDEMIQILENILAKD
jgi:hypothetical protein